MTAKEIRAMLEIWKKLAEAERIAEEVGIRTDPLGPTGGDKTAPANVLGVTA